MLLINFTNNQIFVRIYFAFPVSFIRRGDDTIFFCIPYFFHKKGGKYIFCHSLSKWLMPLFEYDILCDYALDLNCVILQGISFSNSRTILDLST